MNVITAANNPAVKIELIRESFACYKDINPKYNQSCMREANSLLFCKAGVMQCVSRQGTCIRSRETSDVPMYCS
jgi:hypothetical protein